MKKVVISFIAGAIFATAGSAAASVIEKITASVRTDYSVEVDGQKVDLENAPIAYQGSAYIAVREISNVIGKEVEFENGVIKISTPEIIEELTAEQYLVKLNSLNWFKDSYVRKIDLIKEAIRRADNGEFKPSEADYQEYEASLSEYQKLLIDVEQEIADLKAAYPQYAESAE
ncbi:hypothetical protein RB620_04370 [Paenibacillus sp. LHD-117]|uniref:stalk domain-containing protein n=1 Tax=Paenibacillus sp. LHD-117 TaxID=3071412 RepID=UPI0027DF407E|nr:hypothetical protein [Paenibacillus sp. LHD-117]MDQ6418667.1 hypothetical protein [Paenibacillus sp. LHD-117]